MCILFLHVDPNPSEGNYRFIVAANRDEYYKRPAQAAKKNEETNVIGGQDMEPGREGGMWLGFRTKEVKNGKGKIHTFAALTNVTGDKRESAGGRGGIVADYLKNNELHAKYVKSLEAKDEHLNGYNFITVELSKFEALTFHHSNSPKVDSVYTGKHTLGFGNSPTFSPLTKVLKGRNNFEEIISKEKDKEELKQQLLSLLKDRTKQLPDDELKKRQPLGYEFLCTNFIESEELGYGTRTHSIILIDHDWNLEFVEHTLHQPIDLKDPKWDINVIKSRL